MEGCAHFEELISQSLDEPLSSQDQQALEAHLAQCPHCRTLAQQLEQLHEELSTLEDIEPPAELVAGVMERIRAEQRPKVIPLWRRPQIRALAGMAACAAICVGLWGAHVSGEINSSVADTAPMSLENLGPAIPIPDSTENEPQEAYDGLMLRCMPEEPAVCALPEDDAALLDLEPDCYNFENAQYIRVAYGISSEAPSAQILGSADSLSAFLAQFPGDDLSALSDAYGPEFFQTGRLLAVVVEEPSGSIRHEIDPQGLKWDQVTILRQIPEVCTDDTAAWLILAEVDSIFEDSQEFKVAFIQ